MVAVIRRKEGRYVSVRFFFPSFALYFAFPASSSFLSTSSISFFNLVQMAAHLASLRSNLRPFISPSRVPFRFHSHSHSRFIGTKPNPLVTYVPPQLPTALEEQKSLAFPDGNELFLQLKAVACYVLPEELDISKFNSALSQTLARFPPFSGRLQRSGDDWRIDLTNSGVPVEIVEDVDSTHVVPPHLEHAVVQPTLDSFLSPVSLEGAMKGEDVPLTTFKITKLKKSGRTVIGHSWNHVLGDYQTATRFIQTLSQYYQDLPPPPQPTFHKRSWPQPPSSADGEALYKKYTPHIVKDYPFEEVLGKYGAEALHSPMVDLNFTAKQLDALHAIARRWQPDDDWCAGDALKVSRQDAMSAYLVTLQNRCLPAPIHTLMNMMNYRTREPEEDALWRHPNNAGNCVYLPSVDLSSAQDIGSISRAIRRNVTTARSKEFLETYLTLNSASQNHIVKHGRFHIFPGPSVALANSVIGLDRKKVAHFGFPGRTQFYNEVSWERMFRIFPANPVRAADGTWTSNEGNVVVSLRVPGEIKGKMVAMMEKDMRKLDMGQELDI
ncbi:transferase family-domain-containing protein [Mycena crocata]|nr:transferase family-domain-containing protein [Mycena crocata]